MPELAIIIPAFKIDFLEKALNSLVLQTNRDFNVYIGDDCSCYDVRLICSKFTHSLNLNYHRFDANLGSIDLVAQWERCVSLMRDENWLWLFADDDMAEPNCVEAFYDALRLTENYYDVYRFNTEVIDANDKHVSAANDSPTIEDAMSMAYYILLGERGNSMPDHIFRRTTYDALGGFVNFSFGQAADWATSINFAYQKGIYTISGPKVKWRLSGKNLSALASAKKEKMIFGYLEFIKWINNRFNEEDEKKSGISRSQIKSASLLNLKRIIFSHYNGLPGKYFIRIVHFVNGVFRIGYLSAFVLCFKINLSVYRARHLKNTK